VERYDANCGKDAGNNMATACKISLGKYKGFIAKSIIGKYRGDDEEDWYALHLERGQTVNVKVTPELDGEVWLHLYNQDLEKIDSVKPKNIGAIVKSSWKAPSAQNIYIVVTSDIGVYTPGGPYTLEVDIKGREPTPTPTLTSSPTPISDENEDTPGFEAVFAIAGLLTIAYLLRRHKNE